MSVQHHVDRYERIVPSARLNRQLRLVEVPSVETCRTHGSARFLRIIFLACLWRDQMYGRKKSKWPQRTDAEVLSDFTAHLTSRASSRYVQKKGCFAWVIPRSERSHADPPWSLEPACHRPGSKRLHFLCGSALSTWSNLRLLASSSPFRHAES